MKKELLFIYSFGYYNYMNISNSFACVYMYVEKYDGSEPAYCGGKLKECDDCGGCKKTLKKLHEELFFMFGTLSGSASERQSFSGDKTLRLQDSDECMEYLMNFAGYTYKIITDNIYDEIVKSIDRDIPILAKLKNDSNGRFRIISGYDGKSLIIPEILSRQRNNENPPEIKDIACLYVIENKSEPSATVKDGFRNIIRVMEHNAEKQYWKECINKFNYWNNYADAGIEDIKSAFQRIQDIMWATFNCHEFSESFCRKLYHMTDNDELRRRYNKINQVYGSTHDLCWQVIALFTARDWTKKHYNEIEWGLCNCVLMCLEQLEKNDAAVLNLIKECYGMMEE